MTRDELKRQVWTAIDARAETVIVIGERIRRQPELGFKETKTAALVEETLAGLGLKTQTGLAVPGVKAVAPGGRGGGPSFAVIGELDALGVAGHPEADPATGAAHACGHNAQIAGMLGAAIGLHAVKAFAHLSGRVVFFAVPAEEGGDLAMMIHTTPRAEDGKACARRSRTTTRSACTPSSRTAARR
jgi:metal-dependent amidase/aminoacylase/carboxypeptidase family protein